MKKFKANDNKSEEHEINYRQFNKKLELLNQILPKKPLHAYGMTRGGHR